VHFVVFVHVVIRCIVDAFVLFTHLSSVVIMCIVLHSCMVPPPWCTVTWSVHLVISSIVNAFVHFTHLSLVVVACVVVDHSEALLLLHLPCLNHFPKQVGKHPSQLSVKRPKSMVPHQQCWRPL
jgi:uncharacterized membrane protein